MTSVNSFKEDKINVFPNPASKTLFIEGFDEVNNVEYEIINVNGEVVEHQILLAGKVEIEEFVDGIYTLRLISNSLVKSFPFVKF